jgi:hypothetical protein
MLKTIPLAIQVGPGRHRVAGCRGCAGAVDGAPIAALPALLDSATMDIGVEISLYPLQAQYRAAIHDFIDRLQRDQRLRVVTSTLSTQLFGEYDVVMQLLSRELRTALEGEHQAVCIIKLFGALTA